VYSFDWAVKDAASYNDYSHQETRNGDKTDGYYHVALPDGRTQRVTYNVNGDYGYVADVQYDGEAKYEDNYKPAASYPQSQYKPAASYRQPQYAPAPAYKAAPAYEPAPYHPAPAYKPAPYKPAPYAPAPAYKAAPSYAPAAAYKPAQYKPRQY
jgi:hypothetical protein